VGVDRRRSPERVARVLREIDADVVGVQELDARPGVEHGYDQWVLLAALAGYVAIPGPTLHRADAAYGNGIFTRLPIVSHALLDLSIPRREPRGAIDATLAHAGAHIRVVVTHLGLRRSERREQGQRLIAHLSECQAAVSVLMGDFNEWFASSAALRRLHRLFGRPTSVSTFPSLFPLMSLDRIWLRPTDALRGLRAHRSRTARIASDHLPIIADLVLPAEREPEAQSSSTLTGRQGSPRSSFVST
jgi:endonuclease/exonuclease/phosphatase family metal-dependent hydrolase